MIDSGNVRFGTVADVLVEMKIRIFSGKVNHIVVASNLGDDGGGGYFANFIIAFYASGSVLFEWGASKEIDFAVNDNLGKRCVKALN